MVQQLRVVCFTPINLVLFIYALFAFAPLLAFASLWAVPFFRVVGGASNSTAGLLASMFLIGTGLGSPVGGFLSDRFQGRKRIIILMGICLSSFSMCMVLFGTDRFLHNWTIGLFMFTGGLGVAPVQLLAFFVAKQNNPHHLAAVATAVVNTAGLLSGAAFQPLVGALLDLNVVQFNATLPGVTNATTATNIAAGESTWSSEHMRIVYSSVFLTCYGVAGFIAAFVFPKEEQKVVDVVTVHHEDQKEGGGVVEIHVAHSKQEEIIF